MKERIINLVIEYSVAGVSFMLGALVSAIILIPFEENLLQFLRKRWWLFRKKAVRGTIVTGYFIDNQRKEEDYQNDPMGYLMRGKPLGPYKMYFELKLPYSNIKEDAMPIERSDDLIRSAYFHKYKKQVHVVQNYPMNEVSPRGDIIIRKEDLDMKPPE